MTQFLYDDITLQFDDSISTYDGSIPETIKFYRVKKLGKVDSSGFMLVGLELISRPEDLNLAATLDPGFTPGTSPAVPAVVQEPFYYRVSGIDIVPGTGYKRIILEKTTRPIDYTGQ